MSHSDITERNPSMRIFVTGASGWIASAVISELLEAGHAVVGLARSDDSAAAVERLGATVDQGVRPAVVRLPRSVHGEGERHGFVPQLVGMFRESGTAMYVGEGTNRWSAVHVADAARLFRLALERATPAAVLHAVGDEGIAVRTLAEALGERLGLPTESVGPERLGFFGLMQTMDHATTAARTRELFDWAPTHPGLLEDIAAGHYDR